MAWINLEGEREALTQNSEQYGKKVIEQLKLKDYYLEQTYKGYFDYTSLYDIYLLDKAAEDLIQDLPEAEAP